MDELRCPRCRAGGPVSIKLTTKGGEHLSMYSCNACDSRWWHRDGESVDLKNVLALAATWGKAAS